jgi:glycosyltransferase involved in cell wall biosynthesis
LPLALTLAESAKANNPNVDFAILIIGTTENNYSDKFVDLFLYLEDFKDLSNLKRMAAYYDVMEFSTSLKPLLLEKLLERYEEVAYLDPDIYVTSNIEDVFYPLSTNPIALTPHVLKPMPRDGLRTSEKDVMQSGIYNLGFISVSRAASRFLNWWSERLTFDAVNDLQNSLFTDQRWVDWAPALFEVSIIKNSRFNVAYWNIHERVLTKKGNQFDVDGQPLGFFHFSGFDPENLKTLSRHTGHLTRTYIEENSSLHILSKDYGSKILSKRKSQESEGAPTYLFDKTPCGLLLTHEIRRALRHAYANPKEFTKTPPADPWKSDDLRNWLLETEYKVGPARTTTLALGYWLTRGDLNPTGAKMTYFDALRMDSWSRTDENSVLMNKTISNRKKHHLDSTEQKNGWSILAYARGEFGVGEMGRRLHSAFALTGAPTQLVGVDLSLSRQHHPVDHVVSERASFSNVVACVNADQIQIVSEKYSLSDASKRIGYWAWELEEFPDKYRPAFDQVDEVWALSGFAREAISKKTEKPVRHVPIPIVVPSFPTQLTRPQVQMPEDTFVFLVVFDYLSVPKRKNPQSTIKAFLLAFPEPGEAHLIVKSINGYRDRAYSETLQSLAIGRNDITFIDEYFSSEETRALIELADVFVSLHRSEGYGLNIADAMAYGTPVIATAYGGNMDFMNESIAGCVNFELVRVGKGSEPYDSSSFWAEPDIHHAANLMRKFFDKPEIPTKLSIAAKKHVRENFSVEQISKQIKLLIGKQDNPTSNSEDLGSHNRQDLIRVIDEKNFKIQELSETLTQIHTTNFARGHGATQRRPGKLRATNKLIYQLNSVRLRSFAMRLYQKMPRSIQALALRFLSKFRII